MCLQCHLQMSLILVEWLFGPTVSPNISLVRGCTLQPSGFILQPDGCNVGMQKGKLNTFVSKEPMQILITLAKLLPEISLLSISSP